MTLLKYDHSSAINEITARSRESGGPSRTRGDGVTTYGGGHDDDISCWGWGVEFYFIPGFKSAKHS